MSTTTVIVAAYNAAGTLGACIEALLGQQGLSGELEIIVVDNNSTDVSAALARGYSDVEVFTEVKQGAYAARNRAVREATGELIAFTDADCIAHSDWIARLQKRMTTSEIQVVMGRDKPAGRSRAVRLLAEYDHGKEALIMSGDDPTVYYGHTNNLMTRRAIFDQVGLFEELLRGADVIFVQRVLQRFGTRAVVYEPFALVDHLEIASAVVYWHKAFIYGKSARRYSQMVDARPLNNRQRLGVFRDVVRRNAFGPIDASYLFVLLLIGVIAYGAGKLSIAGFGADAAAAPETERRKTRKT